MANLAGTFEIVMDSFFKDTRMRYCRMTDCEFNAKREWGEMGCTLKKVGINSLGVCANAKVRRKDDAQ